MRIATYNLWNSRQGQPLRHAWLLRELKALNADLLCLQEVKNTSCATELAGKLGYAHTHFAAYPGQEEGLCMLSRTPLEHRFVLYPQANAIGAVTLAEDTAIGLFNLHLPWDSPLCRERQAVALTSAAMNLPCTQLLLLGDFNCSDTSDVQRFFLGDTTLRETEAKPCYFDLARTYAERMGTTPDATLQFRRNPRFTDNTIEADQRFDRILLRNPYPNPFPELRSCRIFGEDVCPENGLAASDHYGVAAEIAFGTHHSLHHSPEERS